MKVTLRVSLVNNQGGTNSQLVNTTAAALRENQTATEAEAGRLAVQELEARDERNDRSGRNWTVTKVERDR